MNTLEKTGRLIRINLQEFLYAMGFFGQIIKEIFFFFRRKQVAYKVLVMQMLFTGVEAIRINAIMALSLGAIIIIQGVNLLPQFGQGQLIYTILITVITRELGPLLTAFVLIARSSTAIATELGNMVVNNEIEAYISVGVNPVSYLVVPRVLGMVFSLIILNIYFNIFGLIGSYFIVQFVQFIPFSEYFRNLLNELQAIDIFSSLIKGVVFGLIISTVATYHGFKVKQSTTEIPVVAIKAVGQSFALCFLANAFFAMLYYL